MKGIFGRQIHLDLGTKRDEGCKKERGAMGCAIHFPLLP